MQKNGVPGRMSALFACVVGLWGVAPSAWALRTTYVAPINMQTVAGGVMALGAANQVCVSADMIPQMFGGAPINNGVCYGLQQLAISIRNTSNLVQNVRALILSGTWVGRAHSNGAAFPVPINNAGNTVLGGDNATQWAAVPPQGRYLFEFHIHCASTGCFMVESVGPNPGRTVLGSAFPLFPAACATPPQVCLAMRSELGVRLEVQEDRGAVIAHITSHGHRSGGLKDHYVQPPIAMAVNGGRPF